MPKVYSRPYSEFRPDEYFRPKTKEEVVSILVQYGDAARVVGAGITIHEMAVLGFLPHVKKLIDIRGIGLDYISSDSEWIRIGASTPLKTVMENEFMNNAAYQTVSEAIHTIPSQVSNAATIAGNICSAVPIVSMPPVLMSLDAQVTLVGKAGERVVPVESLYEDYLVTTLKPDEFLTEVRVPVQEGRCASTYLAEKTVAVDYPTVSISASMTADAAGKITKARIAVGSVGRTAMRLQKTEKALGNSKMDEQVFQKAGKEAAEEIDPSADLRASPEYRRVLTRNLTILALRSVSRKITGA